MKVILSQTVDKRTGRQLRKKLLNRLDSTFVGTKPITKPTNISWVATYTLHIVKRSRGWNYPERWK